MKKLNLLICSFFLLIWACNKDTDVFIPYETVPAAFVTGSVGGVITNEVGIPQTNTTVKLTTKSSIEEMMTDENGIFYFRNVEINAERTYLQIESGSYGNSSRVFTPREEGTEFLKIQLLTTSILDSISVTQGGIVDVEGGASIEIPVDALVGEGGTPFTGGANLGARYLNPTGNNLGDRMPGTLTALNADGELRALATYGMLNFELVSVDGDLVQLATDKSASIRLPIPDQLLNNAPAFIPMWYFDTATGLWIEEGQATLENNYYVGEAGKANFWTIAVPYTPIRLQAAINIFESNIIYPHAMTKMTVVDGGVCVASYTDGAGVIDGYVPSSQLLRFQIFDDCGLELYSADLGPYPDDVNLSDIVVQAPNSNLVQLSGSLVCSGVPVEEGYVKLDFNQASSSYYFADSNGNFTGTFVACNFDIFELTGIDLINNKSSETNTFTTEEIIEVGAIDTCD